MRTVCTDVAAQILRGYAVVWSIYVAFTLGFGRLEGASGIEIFLPILTPLYLTGTGWFAFWRRTAPTIRYFWIGVIAALMFGLLINYAASILFAILYDGTPPAVITSKAYLLATPFSLMVMLFLQLLCCSDAARPQDQNPNAQRVAAKRFIIIFALTMFLLSTKHVPGVIKIAGFGISLITVFTLGNRLLINTVQRTYRLRILYVGVAAILILTIAVLQR